MANYIDQVTTEKKFVSNIVIKIGSTYFAIKQPDSGLTISSPYDKMIVSLQLNQASIDIKKVNTTIASYSFRLLDKNGIVSNLVLGNGLNLVGQAVTIWLGRTRRDSNYEANDFSGYYQLPITRIKKIEHSDNTYTFSTNEDTDRIAKPIYAATSALSIDILSGTTTITMRDSINAFPASGFIRVEQEIFSYTSKDDLTKTFSGVIRGELGTTPDAHKANISTYQTQTITDNPINVILKILISNGGGGIYDTLKDGLGLDPAVIDVTELENLRDTLFLGVQIKLELSNVTSALKLIESEILQPFNLRFKYALNAKLSLVILDKAIFSPIVDSINEDTMTAYPKWTVDDTKIINKLKISWNYDEVTETFLNYSEFTDDASVATYGLRAPLTFSFKGVKASLDGATIINDYARVLFTRFSTPVAEVEVKTQIDKSLKNIGDKVYLESTKIPSPQGGLTFSSDMEVTKRSINYQTNEAAFTFSFTSFTKFRSGFIAPSDLILYIESQKKIGILNGRSIKYRIGFKMRLWNELTQSYESDPPNEIVSFILGQNRILDENGFPILDEDGNELIYEENPNDLIVFKDNWITTLTTNHRIKFANYSEVVQNQKRYCFPSNSGANFSDGKPTYKVTY